MKKTILITVLLLIALLLATIPAGAGSWVNKVTGGGQAKAGSIYFSVNVSAKEDSQGNASGQMQYSRSGQSVPDLSVHARAKCMGVFSGGDVAVAAGPAKAQDDPDGLVSSGTWMVVEVLEGGKGSGDRMRVRLLSQSDAESACSSPSGSFPGLLYDGNFNIRTK